MARSISRQASGNSTPAVITSACCSLAGSPTTYCATSPITKLPIAPTNVNMNR